MLERSQKKVTFMTALVQEFLNLVSVLSSVFGEALTRERVTIPENLEEIIGT